VRFKGFSGPIGSGKSQALCQEAIRMTYLNPGRLGLLGAPTYPMLRDATQATLFEILDSNGIPYEHNKGENTVVMRDTKSKILFRPVEEFERLRGTNLAWFGVDELTYTQEESWLRLEGRLRDPKAARLCGFAVWTPKGYDWVHRKFLANPKPGYAIVLAEPRENRHLLEKIPDFYDRLKDSYDERFYRQEVLGLYLNLDGSRVYSSFERTANVRRIEVDQKLPLLWTLDFNVDPMCSIVAQKDGGQFRVVDEIVLRHATTVQACEEFLKRYPRHMAGVKVFGDAAGRHEQTTGSSDFQIIQEMLRANSGVRAQYCVPQANPVVRDRLNVVNGLLRSASGDVGLLVDERCRELIQDFEQVSYKANSGQIDKDRDRMRTHLSDAVGYLVYEELLPPVGERRGRLV
jgi:Terminase large subunit, T4likevirus-type, N-terminal